MEVVGIKLREKECFKEGFSGFDEFKLLNVIIGKNNVGKSRLLDLVRRCCEQSLPLKNVDAASGRVFLTKAEINNLINEVFGSNYRDNQDLVDALSGMSISITWSESTLVFAECPEFLRSGRLSHRWKDVEQWIIRSASRSITHRFHGSTFAHLSADRDIRAETEGREVRMESNGERSTDIIQYVLHTGSADDKLIKHDVLHGLNEIFSGDGHFSSIQAKRITDKDEKDSLWEVFLEEENKGAVPLSKSGSGLKTVILVLLYLHVVPKVVFPRVMKTVYAFEELENNLHPSLFRRLLSYIANFARAHQTTMFITTHSSVALDVFGTMEDAQIIHIKHNGKSASTTTIRADFDKFNVVSELGAKPSDLLQANGLIWVEGPSDRIYVNRWIEIFTEGKYTEGVHYQCVFYGGSLLANLEVVWDEEHKERLVNLLKVNANLAVIMDSDRKKGGTKELKERVARIMEEVDKAGALQWVTWGKEIENYLPGSALSEVFSKECRDPEQREVFFPPVRMRAGAPSYVEDVLGVKVFDKTARALQIAPCLTMENMKGRGDWPQRISELVAQIEKWNR